MLFVQEGLPVREPIVEAVRNYSEANGVPIRMLFGSFRNQPVPAWTTAQATACDTTLSDARSRGVTLTVWGASSPIVGADRPQIPGAFYTDGVEREAEIRETVAPDSNAAASAIPYFLPEAPDVAIGEIEDKSVWYFFHLGYMPEAEMLDMDRVIIEPIRASQSSTRIEEFRAEATERSALLFVAAMKDMPKQRLAEKIGRADAHVARISALEQQLNTEKSAATIIQKEIDYMLSGDIVSDDHWKKQWTILHSHPMIRAGTLSMQGLVVSYETEELMIEDVDSSREGWKYPIGSFRIKIDLEHFNFNVRNLTNRIDNKDHPHVRDETPCLGDYHSEVSDLFVSRELAALVEWLFSYLESYNPADDYGRAIRLWRDKAEMDGTVVKPQ